jgi:hypothetical protein
MEALWLQAKSRWCWPRCSRGAALYLTVAEQPARLHLDAAQALRQWKPSYARAAVMQASLAVLSSLAGLAAAWQLGDWRFVLGAALMLANLPYTVIVIMPTNAALKATPEAQAGAETRALIEGWGRLHGVRTALGIAAALSFLWALSA